jgi:hypothetical protein
MRKSLKVSGDFGRLGRLGRLWETVGDFPWANYVSKPGLIRLPNPDMSHSVTSPLVPAHHR